MDIMQTGRNAMHLEMDLVGCPSRTRKRTHHNAHLKRIERTIFHVINNCAILHPFRHEIWDRLWTFEKVSQKGKHVWMVEFGP